ncbi:MAG: hypothetical protein IT495_16085 [Gammaproteobacteria bacterium]|nr:hypothetical protein [Gammaproteobacteria bacterium]
MRTGGIIGKACIGAVVGAGAMAAYQYYVLAVVGGADLARVPPAGLLLEVMTLQRYAAFGAALGATGGLLTTHWMTPWSRLLLWSGLGVLAGFLVPFTAATVTRGVLPTASELGPMLGPGNKFLLTGVLLGVVMAALESLARVDRSRPATRPLDDEGNVADFDAVANDDLRRRADAYLAARRAARRAGSDHTRQADPR